MCGTHSRCENCGLTFKNEYYLVRHKRDKCDANQEWGNATNSANGISSKKKVASNAKGRVQKFFQDEGYGFIVTADVTTKVSDERESTCDVFIHISNTDTTYLEKGDRLTFDVIETDDGLAAENATVLERVEDRDEPNTEARDPAERLRFGRQVDDTKYGFGKVGPTERKIESFKDERKFR